MCHSEVTGGGLLSRFAYVLPKPASNTPVSFSRLHEVETSARARQDQTPIDREPQYLIRQPCSVVRSSFRPCLMLRNLWICLKTAFSPSITSVPMIVFLLAPSLHKPLVIMGPQPPDFLHQTHTWISDLLMEVLLPILLLRWVLLRLHINLQCQV